jgi:hypothetical protein
MNCSLCLVSIPWITDNLPLALLTFLYAILLSEDLSHP